MPGAPRDTGLSGGNRTCFLSFGCFSVNLRLFQSMQFILKISKTSTSRSVFFITLDSVLSKGSVVTDVFLLSALGS